MGRHPSICRVCQNVCPVEVETQDGRVVGISGDGENAIYRGYMCVKGREHWVAYNHPDRLLHSLKRSPKGDLVPLPVDHAIDEIADQLQTIINRYGPRSVALYWGTNLPLDNVVNVAMADAFMTAIGSPMTFNSATIDQPGKVLAKGLHGVWMAPGQALHDPDVALLVGNNPLVSHQGRLGNPGDFIKDLTRRGGELIVIDPRRTETAKRAAIHLQPRPGEDVAILAAIIRLIVEENLCDAEFLADNVTGLDELTQVLEPFTPSYVAARADINSDDLVSVARVFGRARRGYVAAGTGPNMAGRSTLLEYLVLCLDTVCGHWMRAGERINNAISIVPRFAQPSSAQAVPPFPTFGYGEKMRVRGLGQTAAGMPSGALAEEILLPGDGQVKALLSLGGNPANSVPDQLKVAEALRSLDLLVQTDVQMSATAKLAHYVIALKLAYEQPGTNLTADFFSLYANGWGLPESYAQYTPAIVEPPSGSDVIDQWRLLYRIAQRMGLQLHFFNGFGSMTPGGSSTPLDMTNEPDTDDLLAITHSGSRIALDEVKRHPKGALFPDPPVYVAPKDPNWAGRLDVGNTEMMADLAAEAEPLDVGSERFPFRLISRRMMHVINTPSLSLPANRPRYNPAFLNPEDLTRLDVRVGDVIEIESSRAAILAIAAADDTVREGTVSLSHAFGDPPGLDRDVHWSGSNSGRLVGSDGFHDPYSGQPRMSNIPVRVAAVSLSAD